MNEENEMIRAIARLIEKTQDGEIRWEASAPSEDITTRNDIIVERMFCANLDKRRLRLYELNSREYTDEDIWHWSPGVALELSDEEKMSWWQFPPHPTIWDLLESVKFKVVGVKDFIAKILKDSP